MISIPNFSILWVYLYEFTLDEVIVIGETYIIYSTIAFVIRKHLFVIIKNYS